MTRLVQPERNLETGLVRIRQVALSLIQPAPENDQLYRPVDPADPEIQALAESIRKHGVREPLVITQDGYILSGHRRYAAARLAGLRTVPVREEPINRTDDLDDFVVLLREYNRQREKSFDEKLREEILTVDPTEAFCSLLDHRKKASTVAVQTLDLPPPKSRAEISDAKFDMVEAIKRIVFHDRRDYWPLSDRIIHYVLLNYRPLRHRSKPDSHYRNDPESYKDLTDLLTRLRLTGVIPFEAIGDETRPVTLWNVHNDVRSFIRQELDGFLKGFWRNLPQSQPNHIEILVEKNTIAPIVKPVAEQFWLPMTSGRGFCSLPPRNDLRSRYIKSGKDQLVLIIVSDFDPEGADIATSFARSMRDDFGIDRLVPIQAALTKAQATRFQLPEDAEAKKGSSRYKKFVAKHGPHVWELEALDPKQLQGLVRDAIDSVIDAEAFNAEIDAEVADSAHLEGVRRVVHQALKEANLDQN